MKFIDINKKNNPRKLNIIALVFVFIAIAGVFLNIKEIKQKPDKKAKIEKLKKIANDTTLKHININYKTADSGEFTGEKKLSQTSEYTQKFYKTMISVTILFVLLMLIAYLLKKRKITNLGSGNSIKILDRKYLGQKQYLTTIVVEKEKLLLGVTDHSITLLKTLESKAGDTKKPEDYTDDEKNESFPKILGKLRRNLNDE